MKSVAKLTEIMIISWLNRKVEEGLFNQGRWSDGEAGRDSEVRRAEGFFASGRSTDFGGDRYCQGFSCGPGRAFGWAGLGGEDGGREFPAGIRFVSRTDRGAAGTVRFGGGLGFRAIRWISEAFGGFFDSVGLSGGPGIRSGGQSEPADFGGCLVEDRSAGRPEPGGSSPAGKDFTLCHRCGVHGGSEAVGAVRPDVDVRVESFEGSDPESVVAGGLSGVGGFLSKGCLASGFAGDTSALSFGERDRHAFGGRVCWSGLRGWSDRGSNPEVSEYLSDSPEIHWHEGGGWIPLGGPVGGRPVADGCERTEGAPDRDFSDSVALSWLSVGTNHPGSGKALGSDLCGRDWRSLGVPALAAGDEAFGLESGGSRVREILRNTPDFPARERNFTLGGLSGGGGGNHQGPIISPDLSESSGKPGHPEGGQETGPGKSSRQDSEDSFCDSAGPDKVRPGVGISGASSLKNGKRSPLKSTWRPDSRPRSGTKGPLTGYILNWIRVVGQAIGFNTHRDAGCDNHDKLNIPGGEGLPNGCNGSAFQGDGRSFFNR